MSNQRANFYVALLGAYERDNFGDILFLKMYERLLDPCPVAPLSLVSRDMSTQGAGTVIGAKAWFEICQEESLPPSAVIVVGGEVLTSAVSAALTCGMDREKSARFYKLSRTHRAQLASLVSGNDAALAYVPTVNSMHGAHTQTVPYALNSCGGTGLAGRPDIAQAAVAASEMASYVSVRDRVTHDALQGSLGDKCVYLDPDIVTAIKEIYSQEVEEEFEKELALNFNLKHPYIVFQASDKYLKETGIEIVADALVKVCTAYNLNIIFQPAGVATGHDSVESLERVKTLFLSACGSRSIAITQDKRNAWTQVALIAHTACFIGTSLHGRIVAGAFARPRVSLQNGKVSAYATTWEKRSLQPHDVVIDDLTAAVASAISVIPNDLENFALSQAEGALKSFERMRSSLNIDHCVNVSPELMKRLNQVRERALLSEATRLQHIAFDLGVEYFRPESSGRGKDTPSRDPAYIPDSPHGALMQRLRRALFGSKV